MRYHFVPVRGLLCGCGQPRPRTPVLISKPSPLGIRPPIFQSEGPQLPQGARKSAAKIALLRATLALTVSIDLSASDGEQDEIRVGKGREGRGGTVKVWNHLATNSRLGEALGNVVPEAVSLP